MKIKKIRQAMVPMLLVALLLVCSSIIGVSAATEKTYLDTMGYSEFVNPDCPKNNFSPFSGEDRHDNKCTRGVKFYITGNRGDVSTEVYERGVTSYYVCYAINNKYESFLTDLRGASNYDNSMEVGIKFFGDEKLLYGTTVTEDTYSLPLELDVKGVNTFKIEIISTTGAAVNSNQGAVITNNAYFTSNGSTPVPTERPTQPTTEKPTQAPTKPVVNPTSAPATEVTTAADTKATTATDSTKATSSVKPIDVNPQTTPTSKVSTADTAKPNTSNTTGTKGSTTGNGFVKTGDIPFIVLIALAVIGAGTGVVFFIRKKKFMK